MLDPSENHLYKHFLCGGNRLYVKRKIGFEGNSRLKILFLCTGRVPFTTIVYHRLQPNTRDRTYKNGDNKLCKPMILKGKSKIN